MESNASISSLISVNPDEDIPPLIPPDRPHKTLQPGRPPRNRSYQNRKPHNIKPYNQQHARNVEKTLSLSAYLSPMKNYYRQQTCFEGITAIATHTYNTLKYREARAVQHLTLAEFVYANKLLVFTRIYYVARRLALFEFPTCTYLETLIETARGIVLPDFLASYIDSIGSVTVAYKKIVPFIISPREFVNSGYFVSPYPNIDVNYENFRNIFSLGEFNSRFIRVKTIAHSLRALNFDTAIGRFEMIITYFNNPDEESQLEPRSPFSTPDDVARKGASYHFWNDEIDRDLGDYEQFPRYAFNGRMFEWEDYVRNILNSTITPLSE
jgi:hypothetical protein